MRHEGVTVHREVEIGKQGVDVWLKRQLATHLRKTALNTSHIKVYTLYFGKFSNIMIQYVLLNKIKKTNKQKH